jgi:hypothetical protein
MLNRIIVFVINYVMNVPVKPPPPHRNAPFYLHPPPQHHNITCPFVTPDNIAGPTCYPDHGVAISYECHIYKKVVQI